MSNMELKNISDVSTKELSLFLLKLVAAGVLIGAVFVAPGISILAQYFPDADRRDRQRIKRNLQKLKEKGYLKYDPNNLETRVVLSTEGQVFMNEEVLFDLKFTQPKAWDGKWFVVMFDIPITKAKKTRHLLREKLLEVGFINYQNSVYIFPYQCKSMINDIEKILGLKNCVQTMVVEKADGEESLKKHFNLQ